MATSGSSRSSAPWQAIIANRWKGQINENSKNHIFVNQFPELNHNEILAWVKAGEQGVGKYVGIILEDGTESAKMKKRAEVTEGLVKDLCSFQHVAAVGETLLESSSASPISVTSSRYTWRPSTKSTLRILTRSTSSRPNSEKSVKFY